MKGSNFNLRKIETDQKSTKLHRAMYEPLRQRSRRINQYKYNNASVNKVDLSDTLDLKFKDLDHSKTRQVNQTFESNNKRWNSKNPIPNYRNISSKNKIKEAKLKKNFSISKLNYDVDGKIISTVKGYNSPPKIGYENFKSLQPSSVKHSSKPSTNASSLMRQQIGNSTINYNKSISKERGNFANVNIQIPPAENQNLGGYKRNNWDMLIENSEIQRKSWISNSSANSSSVYASRRGKKITELNNSKDMIKYSMHTDGSKISKNSLSNNQAKTSSEHSKNKETIQNTKLNSRISRDTENWGLHEKYITKSIDSEEECKNNEEKWEEHQDEAFHNLASVSWSSLGSVPDEYTANRSKKQNLQFKIDRRQNNGNQKKDQINSTQKLMLQSNGRNNNIDGNKIMYQREYEDEEAEDEVEETNNLNEGSYSLHIPSMVTHLKRKDDYLESLDSFLNENLRVITDLIRIK